MNIQEILTPELTLCNVAGHSKKKLLETISHTVSEADSRIKYQKILHALQDRERLGSTSIGYGVAIPHSRIEDLNKALCVLITLDNAIDYDDKNDAHKVDLIVGLLVPEDANEEHINILAQLAEKFSNTHYRDLLRKASTPAELYNSAISDNG